ncbi:hypothetical protein ACHAPC_002085 [Botrytis cinerea]
MENTATKSSSPEDDEKTVERNPSSSDSKIDGSRLRLETKPVDEVEYQVEYVSGVKLAIIIASVAFSCFLVLVDNMIVSTAIPRITNQFKSLRDVGWYASAYQFGSAAPQPLTGKIYTHFKTKWVFLTFFSIFELGSLLCGVANSSVMLICGRAVAGLGAAGILSGALTIISSCAAPEKRANLIGITLGLNQLGLVVGPLLGGVFTTFTTWRWCFYINLPLGAVSSIAIILLRIPEQTRKAPIRTILPKLHHYLDLIGFCLFAPAIVMLLLALQYGGNQFAWNSSQVIGLFCGFAATIVVWYWWNSRLGDKAMLPLSLVTKRVVAMAVLYQAFMMACLYGAIYFLPIYFQAILNTNAMLSGVYLLPTILPQLFMAGLSGPMIMKVGYLIPFAIFSTVLMSIGAGLYSTLGPNSSSGKWAGFQVLSGIGSGAGLQVTIIAIQAATTGEELSSAMAFLIFGQTLGPAIVLVICNVIFDNALESQLPQHAPHINATAIIDAGATGFRAFVDEADLPGVLLAYSNSIDRAFYLVAAMGVMCGFVLWGLGWQNVSIKATDEQNEQDKKVKESTENGITKA